MVYRTVREFSSRVPRFVDSEELLAAGMLGLAQAHRAYDSDKGVPFEIYARTRVTGAILDDLRSRDWLTRPQRDKAKRVVDALNAMQTESSEVTSHASRPKVAELARRTKMTPAAVHAVLKDLDRAHNLGQTGEVSDPTLADRIRCQQAGPLEEVLESEAVANVRRAVSLLPTRLRHVIEGVYFEGRQMQTVAAELGVTPSRVSQMCADALTRLRRSLTAADDSFDDARAS